MCPYCKEKVDLKRMFSNPYPFDSVILTPLLFFSEYPNHSLLLIGVMSEIMYSNEQCACIDCLEDRKKTMLAEILKVPKLGIFTDDI